jgi:hypothetical protein
VCKKQDGHKEHGLSNSKNLAQNRKIYRKNARFREKILSSYTLILPPAGLVGGEWEEGEWREAGE